MQKKKEFGKKYTKKANEILIHTVEAIRKLKKKVTKN